MHTKSNTPPCTPIPSPSPSPLCPPICKPQTFKVLETENHLLMANGALYLLHTYASRTGITEYVMVLVTVVVVCFLFVCFLFGSCLFVFFCLFVSCLFLVCFFLACFLFPCCFVLFAVCLPHTGVHVPLCPLSPPSPRPSVICLLHQEHRHPTDQSASVRSPQGTPARWCVVCLRVCVCVVCAVCVCVVCVVWALCVWW